MMYMKMLFGRAQLTTTPGPLINSIYHSAESFDIAPMAIIGGFVFFTLGGETVSLRIESHLFFVLGVVFGPTPISQFVNVGFGNTISLAPITKSAHPATMNNLGFATDNTFFCYFHK